MLASQRTRLQVQPCQRPFVYRELRLQDEAPRFQGYRAPRPAACSPKSVGRALRKAEITQECAQNRCIQPNGTSGADQRRESKDRHRYPCQRVTPALAICARRWEQSGKTGCSSPYMQVRLVETHIHDPDFLPPRRRAPVPRGDARALRATLSLTVPLGCPARGC